MNPQIRGILVALVAAIVAALIVFLFVNNPSPPGSSRLERTISQFMKCLPDETTDAQREEIEGIMTRFHDKARTGRVHLDDLDEIRQDLSMYIERGEITRLELNDFMSKVGTATRRMDEEQVPPAD
ncbi:MAG: hypothetical protein JSW58_10165 [Candidatus Latescibacterota bacterium]|nr:MAG: hypothetical protein JSW58_10165 [Candidatus Latescibacterota bacterium]